MKIKQVTEASDISGLLAASELNKEFVVRIEVDGEQKRLRVKAQSARVAGEKVEKYLVSKGMTGNILSVKEKGEGMPVEQVQEADDDMAVFVIDGERAYQQVMDRFGDVIEWSGDYMVAPRKVFLKIEEVVFDAGGDIEEITDDAYYKLGRKFHETIEKIGSKYRLVSKHGHKNLGTYDTKAGAEKRERQVQYFKHAGK
jgi:hypothetical protein